MAVSSKAGVSSIIKVCLLMESCDGHGGCNGVWEGIITFRRCDILYVDMKDV